MNRLITVFRNIAFVTVAFLPVFTGCSNELNINNLTGTGTSTSTSTADPGSMLWDTMLGGSNNEEINAVSAANGSGVIIAGSTLSDDIPGCPAYGDKDAWIIRLDDTGNPLWMRTLSGNSRDEAQSILAVSGGYLACGFTTSPDLINNSATQGLEAWIMLLGETGSPQCNTWVGGEKDEIFYNMVHDQNYYGAIVVGTSDSANIPGHPLCGNMGERDFLMAKVRASDCSVQSVTTFGGSGNDRLFAIAKSVTENMYIIAGHSNSSDLAGAPNAGSYDFYAAKVDYDGNIDWQIQSGGSGEDRGYGICVTTDGSIIMAGTSWSSDIQGNTLNGSCDCYVVKMDESGNVLWHRLYGGNNEEWANGIKATAGGSFIITGMTNSTDWGGTSHGDYDMFAISIASDGSTQWISRFGGSQADYGGNIGGSLDNLVIGGSIFSNISGVTRYGGSDAYFIKIEP